MVLGEAWASDRYKKAPLYALASPFFCILIEGLTRHLGCLSVAFFKALINSLEVSISRLIWPILVFLGRTISLTILP